MLILRQYLGPLYGFKGKQPGESKVDNVNSDQIGFFRVWLGAMGIERAR